MAAVPTQLRVLYDVSLLGKGHFDPRYRTGIHRVVDCTLSALLDRDEISVTLAAQESWSAFMEARDFARSDARTRQRPFLARSGAAALDAAVVPLFAAERALPHGSFVRRSLRRSMNAVLRAAEAAYPILSPAVQSEYDVFHAPSGMLPAFRDRAPAVRYLVGIHDLIPELFPEYVPASHRAALRALRERIGPRDVVITHSENTRRDVCRTWGLPEGRVCVVPLAATPEIFYPAKDASALEAVRRKHCIPAGMYVLGLNSLDPRKNAKALIRGFEQFAERRPDLHVNLVLVWNGRTSRDEILREASGSMLADRVVLTGYAPDADLAALYSGARAFVHPSRYEGFGLPLLEAMQCGTPVITSNTSSIPEVVGAAAIQLDPDDHDGLADAIEQVCCDDATHAHHAASGVERASGFTWQRSAAATVAAYQRAAEL